MKGKSLNAIGVLFLLLFLDTLRPWGYSLRVEFIFLGIICLSLHRPFYFSLAGAFIFGYLRDCLAGTFLSASLGFPLIVLFIDYFRRVFVHRYAVFFIVAAAIVVYIILNNILVAGARAPFFSLFYLMFFLHSFFLFFIVERLAFARPRPAASPYG